MVLNKKNGCSGYGTTPISKLLGRGKQGKANTFYRSKITSKYGDFDFSDTHCLAYANDNGDTFAEIADFVEANPSLIFEEAV